MLKQGHRLGDFEIIRFIGKGGMGEVYEAQQTNPQRRVALKVLAPWLANDEAALQRFWREAEVPAQLDHPGIVRIISTGRTPDAIAFYAMQLVRGISLSELIHEAAAFPVESTQPLRQILNADERGETLSHVNEALPGHRPVDSGQLRALIEEYVTNRYAVAARLGAAAARALAAAHQKGFIHRDIKPSNLMVDQHAQLFVVDFGLTRGLNHAVQSTAGVIRGTYWYMSPEQAEGEEIDHRSDIYSLGVTLYELVSQGMGPYTANRRNSPDVLAHVRAGRHLPLRLFAPDVPAQLERVIGRAMSFNRNRRQTNAEDLAAELDEAAKSSATALRVRPVSPWRQRLEWLMSHAQSPFMLGMGVMFLIAAASLFVFLPFQQPGGFTRVADTVLSRDPGPVPKKDLPWPALFPQPYLRHPIALIKEDGEPLWYRQLSGNGKFTPLQYSEPPQFMLGAPPETDFTLLALADEDRYPHFQFAVEIQQILQPNAPVGDNHVGIFFGWHRDPADNLASPPFFALHLDERPAENFPRGRVTVGTGRIIEAHGARAGFPDFLPLRPLADKNGVIALSNTGIWHRFRVRCQASRLRIKIDDLAERDYELPGAIRSDQVEPERLDPRGSLGVWAHRGNALVRLAFFTMEPVAAKQ